MYNQHVPLFTVVKAKTYYILRYTFENEITKILLTVVKAKTYYILRYTFETEITKIFRFLQKKKKKKLRM